MDGQSRYHQSIGSVLLGGVIMGMVLRLGLGWA